MKPAKEINPLNYIKITFAIVILLMGAIMALVLVVDPFFHYKKPLPFFPYQVNNQLSQNPGMARNMDYDSVMLGSSMTVNFESDLFEKELGLKLLKLPYNGAYPRDIRNIMEQVDRNKSIRLKNVFLGMDLSSYTGGIDDIKYPLPEHLYDRNPLNDVKYIYNKDVLLDYCFKPLIEREPTDLSRVYSSEEELKDCYSKAYVLSHYIIPERVEAYFPEDMFIEPLKANLTENILPVISSHPDTEFICFFPPYSILYWYEYLQYSQMDAVLYEYEYTIEELLKHNNVRIFFFPGLYDTVTDLDLYADTGHYKQDINRYMTRCFKTGENRVDKTNYKKVLKDFGKMVKTYDYEGLLAQREG